MKILTKRVEYFRWLVLLAAICLAGLSPIASAGRIQLRVEQITQGPQHHFFGYIGQCQTVPWNLSGRYIVALRTVFHDRMPRPEDAAEIVLLDAEDGYSVRPIEKTRAWNFQQGTMLYWNPKAPESQFFFNDRDPKTNHAFTVLYDIVKRERIREFRFPDTPVGNSGVAQGGGRFLAINYGRLDRLRKVTGYPGAFDWTKGEKAPDDDGIFLVEVGSGEKRLLVSFSQLLEAVQPVKQGAGEAALYINHTLWSREDDRIYFYLRGRRDEESMWLNVPCSIHPDGGGLTLHRTFIGGHPEWAEGSRIIGSYEDRQVLYDVDRQEIVGEIGPRGTFPKPGGDISLSPDGRWFANGFSTSEGTNEYVVFDRETGEWVRSPALMRGPHHRGELRIDPAPRWNRTSDALLVPGWTGEDVRHLFVIRVEKG